MEGFQVFKWRGEIGGVSDVFGEASSATRFAASSANSVCLLLLSQFSTLRLENRINVDDNAEFVVRQLTDMQLTMQSEFHPDEDICPKIEVLKCTYL